MLGQSRFIQDYAYIPKAAQLVGYLHHQCNFRHIYRKYQTCNLMYVVEFFPVWFSWANSYEYVCVEDYPNVVMIPYISEFPQNGLHMGDKKNVKKLFPIFQMNSRKIVKNWIREPLRITSSTEYVLSFLAYDRSYTV